MDRALKAFSMLPPPTTHGQYAAHIKGVFKANHCRLEANITQRLPPKTKRISAGILKAIYESLPREELRLITDILAFCPERVTAVCEKTPISAWEDFNDKYTIIRFDPARTKVRYDHIGILPRQLADRIRQYAIATGRGTNAPFPNHETLWREITKHSLDNYGIRLTSKYLRKEYVAKAKKTPMPPNDWDFLAGHKQKVGNQAHHYDPEDDTNLIREYDQYLAPYLGLGNTKEPDEAGTPFKDQTLEQANKKITELTEQVLELTKLLTKALAKTS
jgi:integrase